jgi:hypothetical protein
MNRRTMRGGKTGRKRRNNNVNHLNSTATDTCDPATDHESAYTCFTLKQLKELRNLWNVRHPDVPITAESKPDIWNALYDGNKHACDRESCWMAQEFAKYKTDSDDWKQVFAPKAPESWKKNPVTWLTSTDITAVMKRYELKHSRFEFIGPAPIDFDSPDTNRGTCVWPELCEFSVKDCLSRKKTKIGIVFNTDPHYKSGSHWIAMFVDLDKRFIHFFDSTGDPCPKQITVLRERIQSQAKALGKSLKYDDNEGVKHQRENTECGVYCLYFITSLLTGKHSMRTFKSKTEKFRDQVMERHRGVFFSRE